MEKNIKIKLIKYGLLILLQISIISCTNDYMNYFLYQYTQEGGEPVIDKDNIKYYEYEKFLLIGKNDSIYYFFDKKTYDIIYISGYDKKFHRKIVEDSYKLYEKFKRFSNGKSFMNILNFDIKNNKMVIEYYQYDKLMIFPASPRMR